MNTLLYCFSILVVVACAENPAGKGQIIVKDTKGTIFTSYSAQKYSEQKSLICYLEGADSAKWSISPETEGILMWFGLCLVSKYSFIFTPFRVVVVSGLKIAIYSSSAEYQLLF